MRSRAGRTDTPLPNRAIGADVGCRVAEERRTRTLERWNDEATAGRAGGINGLGDEGGEVGDALPNPRTGADIGCRVLEAGDHEQNA